MSKRLMSLLIVAVSLMALIAPAFAQSTRLAILRSSRGGLAMKGPALEALIAKYNELYPDVNVINAAVTGGSGVNARAVLKTRMHRRRFPRHLPGSCRPGTDRDLGRSRPDGRPDSLVPVRRLDG